MTGFFITFEGGEGAGKTTQINRLAESLTKTGRKIITTREPGGTKEAETIRNLLVQRDGGNWSAMSEALMMFAARSIHVENVITPALAQGHTVICDRFTDSTRAYQGYGRELNLNIIEQLNQTVLNALEPDLTFILDIEPEAGLKRSERRLASETLNVKQKEDRFENMELEFHTRLRNGFLEIAKANPLRCQVIDATLSLDEVANRIIKAVNMRIV